MPTVSEIIEQLGDTGAVAGALGLRDNSVSSWKSRGSIPGEHWRALVDLAEARGLHSITVDVLASMHARRVAVEARP
jgi:hypothetical protein